MPKFSLKFQQAKTPTLPSEHLKMYPTLIAQILGFIQVTFMFHQIFKQLRLKKQNNNTKHKCHNNTANLY